MKDQVLPVSMDVDEKDGKVLRHFLPDQHDRNGGEQRTHDPGQGLASRLARNPHHVSGHIKGPSRQDDVQKNRKHCGRDSIL